MDITNFIAKLNKLDGNTYTIEEIVTPVDGVYEAELIHDNVEVNTINIYTGSKLTGTKINTYTTSTPSLTPWKTNIKIFSTEPVLYVTYETTGDTVEADDVNDLQDAIGYTQEALNAETDRAIEAEKQLQTNIDNENKRAVLAENLLMKKLNEEITRATDSENTIQTNLNNEITRATNREDALEASINAETTRATKVEGEITTSLNAEISRAKLAESTLTINLNNEITRATKAEQAIQTTISTNKPIWDDKYTKAEIDNKISQVVSNMDWKESVATYNDIATTYPSPQDGWTVNVKDTDITYRWSGTEWIEISANAIPLATSKVDGKMSKDDKWFLETVKGLWNSVTTHISDAVKHITSAERTLWNTVSNKAEKSHTHTKNQIIDMPTKLSQFTNDNGFITRDQIDTSQNHTHTNKSTLDKISDTDLNRIRSRGVVTPETGTTIPAISGMSMTQAYNNGYPSNYGNIISLSGSGHGEIFVGWSGTSGANAPVYVRSKRDTGNADWSPWVQFYTSANPQPSTASATKATQDSDGNQINTTYVKKGTTWNELEGI